MVLAGAKSTWETYGTFLNSFNSKVKIIIQKHEQIEDRIFDPIYSVIYVYILLYINYNDECIGVLHRARTKQHLVFLEAFFILLY